MDPSWLARLAFIVPDGSVTRWILIADLACLIALGLCARRPSVAVPLALAAGFLGLNVLGMLANDFFVGLALFHVVVGAATLLLRHPVRWLGAATLVVALALGALT